MRLPRLILKKRQDALDLIYEYLQIEALSPEYKISVRWVEPPEGINGSDAINGFAAADYLIYMIVMLRLIPPSVKPFIHMLEMITHGDIPHRRVVEYGDTLP